ncbi:MAG: SWIM zinc finger family protein [Psychromonas sp.]
MAAKLIHKTWWGEEFVSALEAYIDPGRLQRGKAYRTDNRVLDFTINGSEIKATLRGNINPYFGITKEPRYKVELNFKQISQKQWKVIINNISGNALWLSKLMLNEIPSDIESAFADEGLLPASYRDVKSSCNCPDYSDPCKHIAGIYYRIAGILDANPMLLFQLRGLAPEKLHQELRKTELGKAFSEHLTLPDAVEMQYQDYKYTPTYSKQDKKTLTTISNTKNAKQFWSMPATVHTVVEDVAKNSAENIALDEAQNRAHSDTQQSVEQTQKHKTNGWPSAHQNSDHVEISAALIKKQGDYPAFWKNNNSFINAMELFYTHTRKKNRKDLF